MSEKIWKYFEESVEMKRSENMWRKDRNFGRRDGNEGNIFERKEERKTILIKGGKEEDELDSSEARMDRKRRYLEEWQIALMTAMERRRAFVWKKDRQFGRQGGKEEYAEER